MGSAGVSPPKFVKVSQGYTLNEMSLPVREYEPVPGDKKDYPWYDGTEKKIFECPAYAIAEVEDAYSQIQSFATCELEGYIDQLLRPTGNLTRQISRTVFQTALKVSKDCFLVQKALQFWVAGRFIEKPWAIVGDETLGMECDTNPRSPYHDFIPVTPIMDFTIDNITINRLLKEALNLIRKRLKEKTLPRKKEDWFEIYLTVFILLNHVDLTMAHDIEFARRHNFPPERKWSNEPLIQMVRHGANTLLAIFQYEKGYYPLLATPDELARHFDLLDYQREHLVMVQALFGELGSVPEEGDELYWTSKMRQSDWHAPAVKVV